ncbi:uncharacterized protein LOC142356260 [Convolutriloba macropyga]|uniref:uncharacterized protein LOC142356260 n=1 Tax=Convolutriloba macropyga TaxID=536237 RepID=UPI003F522CA6
MKLCLLISIVIALVVTKSSAQPNDFAYPDSFVTNFQACLDGFNTSNDFALHGVHKYTIPVELESVRERFEASKQIHQVFPVIGRGLRIELESHKSNLANPGNKDVIYQVTYHMDRYKVHLTEGMARAQLMQPGECLTPTFV